MTHEQVDAYLHAYLVQRARCDYLRHRINELTRQLRDAQEDQIHDLISVTARLSDEPHGTMVSMPTERAGIKMADGYESDDVKDLKRSISILNEYLAISEKCVAYVDAWLRALVDTPYKVVYFKAIERRTWQECAHELEEQYGTYYSCSGLKKIYRLAMQKVYEVAELDAGPYDDLSIFAVMGGLKERMNKHPAKTGEATESEKRGITEGNTEPENSATEDAEADGNGSEDGTEE